MLKPRHYLRRLSRLIPLSALVLMLSAIGCSTSPTQSDEPGPKPRELWNPTPGTEITPGQEVPLLDEDYWETLFGPSVNPLRRLLSEVEFIGESGGSVVLGFHSYQIPAGAVDGIHLFTLSLASLTGVALDCGPSPFYFDEPVLLTMSYRLTQYDRNDGDASNLHIYYMHEDGTLEQLESSVDTEARCVRAHVDHFSRYILG